MKPNHDVIIIGGGPGGSALGTLLARKGLSVLLVDRSKFPREKPCAGLLSPRGVTLVDSIFGEDALAHISCGSSTGARFLHKGKLIGEVTGTPMMHFLKRLDADALFFRHAADAGCDCVEDAEACSVDAENATVTLKSGETLHARTIVGADGAASVVRRCVWKLGRKRDRNLGMGLVAEAPMAELKPGEVREKCSLYPHFYFDALPWGYGWIFPKGDRFSIGVGGRFRGKSDFRGALRALVEANCVAGAWERLELRGRPLPFGNFARVPARANVLLVGDAAGLAEPVTGEGIAFALVSAQLAAEAIVAAFSRGESAEAGRIYSAACRKHLLPQFRQAMWARLLLYPKLGVRLSMRALSRNPDRIRWYFEVANGDISYLQYSRRMVWSHFCR
jgi:geranylgeranyl reductase family protein